MVAALIMSMTGVFMVAVPTASADVSTMEGHKCRNFGDTVWGYRAGHCANVDVFTNSNGVPAVRAMGEAFCQRASDGALVRCTGIRVSVILTESESDSTTAERTFACGLFGNGTACPVGRFQPLSAGLYCNRNHHYTAWVSTRIALTGSGSQTSDLITTTVQMTCA